MYRILKLANGMLRPMAVVLCLILFCSTNALTQNNNCPVVARIDPANEDTMLVARGDVMFTSLSTNATTYKWLCQDILAGPPDRPLNLTINIGLTKISLVASNDVCSDTATVYYFVAGTAPADSGTRTVSYGYGNTNNYVKDITGTPDGGFLMMGNRSFTFPCGSEGIIVKLTDKGCIDWSKRLIDVSPVYCKNVNMTRGHAAVDGSYYIVNGSGYNLLKLDNNGSQLWHKRWQVDNLNLTWANFSAIASDPVGNLYGVGWTFGDGMAVVKLDPQGNVVWTKYLRHSPYAEGNQNVRQAYPGGIAYLNGKLYITGDIRTSIWTMASNFVCQLDAVDGQVGWNKLYSFNTIGSVNGIRLVNNQLFISISSNPAQSMQIDQQGNHVRTVGVSFPNNSGDALMAAKSDVDDSGNMYFMQWVQKTLPLQPYYANYTNFALVTPDLSVRKGANYATNPRGGYFITAAASTKKFASVGVEVGELVRSSIASVVLKTVIFDTAFNSSSFWKCVSESNVDQTTLVPVQSTFTWNTDSTIVLNPVSIDLLQISDGSVESRVNCPDFVDSCSYLKLTGDKWSCTPGQTLKFKAHRNIRCALPINWQIPAGATIVQQTTNEIEVKFPSFGKFTVAVSSNGCFPSKDSIEVFIEQKYALDIGADTFVCNQAPITLRASPVFVNYKWSTGQTDSVITVSQPGSYFVEVTDSCGNILRDSVLVNEFSYPINAGPDRVKCNLDTIHLTAPPGFLNYEWSNNYNLSSPTGATVVVNPLMDTAYYLKAEKFAGCYSFDTIRVKVNVSPRIQLGADTSICADKFVVFDAGPGFSQYQWNNGVSNRTLTANKVGVYIVAATTAEGCVSGDTVRIFNTWPLPVVTIVGEQTLCENGTRVLDAGNFPSGSVYTWNTGNNTRTITVNQTGLYTVVVRDDRGCETQDDFRIERIVKPPANFLSSDTAICTYGKLFLQPLGVYNNYLWNTGDGSRNITITKPGYYWLEVTDANQCVGRDTIIVKQKDCLKGLFVPTAFTPNQDGRNDIFRALIFGNVKSFEFSIFNRWGQMIFRTQDPAKGWDGTIGGRVQNTGTFTWLCKYQFEGEAVRVEKGSFTVIR